MRTVVLSSFVCLLLSSYNALATYSLVLKCYYSYFSDSEMLGFVNKLLNIPRYNNYCSFLENLLINIMSPQFNKQISPVPLHFVQSSCILMQM